MYFSNFYIYKLLANGTHTTLLLSNLHGRIDVVIIDLCSDRYSCTPLQFLTKHKSPCTQLQFLTKHKSPCTQLQFLTKHKSPCTQLQFLIGHNYKSPYYTQLQFFLKLDFSIIASSLVLQICGSSHDRVKGNNYVTI